MSGWGRSRRSQLSRVVLGAGATVVAAGLAAAVVSHESAPAAPVTSTTARVVADPAEGLRPPPLTAKARTGLARLATAARAESGTSYAGRQYVALSSPAGERSAVVDLQHRAGSGYRVTVAPTMATTGSIVLEPEDAPTLVSPLDRQQLRVLAAHYTPSVSSVGERVAGRPTDLVELRDAAGHLAARYWLDRATSLPLQQIAYDEQGRVQRASAYTSITLGSDVEAGAVPSARTVAAAPPGADVPRADALSAADLDALRRSGWAVPQRVGARGLELIDARMVEQSPPTQSPGAQSPKTLHLRYSDGIGTLSVFEEPGHLDSAGLRGWQSVRRAGAAVRIAPGPPEQVVWSSEGRVYTVVAEDADDVDAVIAQLPHSSPATGLRARLWRGVQRVGSWVDPTR